MERLSRMPPLLQRALLPFQRRGVEFVLQRCGRALIADEMGVGKTVQAIALISCYQVSSSALAYTSLFVHLQPCLSIARAGLCAATASLLHKPASCKRGSKPPAVGAARDCRNQVLCGGQDEWPALIVVPASLRLVWAEELAKWLPRLRPSQVHVIEGKQDRLERTVLPQVYAAPCLAMS
jgi:SNF2 family DNA or RNA helicase